MYKKIGISPVKKKGNIYICNMKPLVSVVVPVRNRENLIVRCLESIENQSYRPLELIVVDNDSTDNTRSIVNLWKTAKESGDFKIKILTESYEGACPTRQKGLENVAGEYVIFFDSDDVMRPNLIETAETVFNQNPGVDVVCWPCCIHQLDGSLKIPPFMPDKPIEGHLIHTLFRPQGTMFKTSFINKIGGWSRSIPVWNDFELGLRVILNNGKIKGVNRVLADIYAQENSITGKNFSSKQGLWEKTLELMKDENRKSTHPRKKIINEIIDYRKIILAAQYQREGNKSTAKSLLNSALSNKSKLRKFALLFSYHFTKAGCRGAWRIIGKTFMIDGR